MNNTYEQEFGPGGAYTWPGDLDVAKEFIRAVPGEKSSANCLTDQFFSSMFDSYYEEYEELGFNEDEIWDLADAKVTSTQELFHDAKNWPLPYLVGSAVYYIFSENTEQIHMIYHVSRDFLWLFLMFNEPLFDMLRGKGWDTLYKNTIREGFKRQLEYEIQGLTGHQIKWSSDKDKPWFSCDYFASHAYPEDVLRCLDLVGIDRDLAHLAVDQVFKLQSLQPFVDILVDVLIDKELHALRPHNPQLDSLRFDLNKLTEPLPRILINKAKMTPEFKAEVGRMTHHLTVRKKFHPRQATAFLVDGMVELSITLSTKKFFYYEPKPPMLQDEDESVLSRFTSFQVERANQCYFKKVRLHNLSTITEHFSDYTKLAHTLELYSQSPEGLAHGCNTFQTEQHRETKMRAIRSFEKALKGGGIPKTETKEALNKMLVLATVDKDGNSTEGLLPIEEMKDRIYTIGEPLKINSLYKRQSVCSLKSPKGKQAQKFYKECVKNAARKPRNASILAEQESSD